jgi:hypothetical protein
MGSLFVFYIGNILVDKNTLCNDCFLNRFIGFIQSLQVTWTLFVSSHVTGHKFLEDVHEDSMQFPSQINRFLCSRPDEPLKASRRPVVSRSFSVEDVWTSEQHVRTLGQATTSFTRSWISVGTAWEVYTRCPEDVATRPDANQRFRKFQVSFTDAKRSDNEDRPDMVLLWEESRYFGKTVAEDYLEEANFRPDASSPESEFEQN